MTERNWYIFFTFVFVSLAAWASGAATARGVSLQPFDLLVLSLGSMRLIRLVTYDRITSWIRDMFALRHMDRSGFRLAVHHLLGCPWCIGVWASLLLAFSYYLIPGGPFFVAVLAIAGAASAIQVAANLVGWHAEDRKMIVRGKK